MLKPKYSILPILLFTIALPLMTACGDDDEYNDDSGKVTADTADYSLPASGSITVTISDGTTYTRDVRDGGYRLWATDLDGAATMSFKVYFENKGNTSDLSFLKENHQVSELAFSKNDFQRLQVGTIVSLGEIYLNDFYKDYDGYYLLSDYQTYFEGDVSVTSFVANKTITLKFTDCSFDAKSSKQGNRWSQQGTFSGEITFPLRGRSFFD